MPKHIFLLIFFFSKKFQNLILKLFRKKKSIKKYVLASKFTKVKNKNRFFDQKKMPILWTQNFDPKIDNKEKYIYQKKS